MEHLTKKQIKEIALIYAGSLILHAVDIYTDKYKLSIEDKEKIGEELIKISLKILKGRKDMASTNEILDHIIGTQK